MWMKFMDTVDGTLPRAAQWRVVGERAAFWLTY